MATATYPPPPPPPQASTPIQGETLDSSCASPLGRSRTSATLPNLDLKKELRLLNRELQLHVLELADVLVERASQYARRGEEIYLIFLELAPLAQSLRPYQARAALIHILELQIQCQKQAMEDTKRYMKPCCSGGLRPEEAQKDYSRSHLEAWIGWTVAE